jgi:hypothetical protein
MTCLSALSAAIGVCLTVTVIAMLISMLWEAKCSR